MTILSHLPVKRVYLVYGAVSACLHSGHHLLLFPHPEEESPVWPACLTDQILGVRGKGQADKLVHRDLSSSQHFPLPALLVLEIKHSDGGFLYTFRHSQITSVCADGQGLHALTSLCTCANTGNRCCHIRGFFSQNMSKPHLIPKSK